MADRVRGRANDAAVDERAVRELISAVREALAVYAGHHERHHRNRIHDAGCDVCRMGVPLSRALSHWPDDRETLQARVDALREAEGGTL